MPPYVSQLMPFHPRRTAVAVNTVYSLGWTKRRNVKGRTSAFVYYIRYHAGYALNGRKLHLQRLQHGDRGRAARESERERKGGSKAKDRAPRRRALTLAGHLQDAEIELR